MKVNNIFYSIQGEGRNIGKPSLFIRFSGCNLKCKFCDTSHQTYKEMTVEEIVEKVKGHKNIVLTGGEPLLQQDINKLIQQINKLKIPIEIETNGTIYDPTLINKVHFNVSPKLSNAGYKPIETILKKYNNKCDFKFVIDNKKSLIEAIELIEEYKLKNIIFMPEGIDKKIIERRVKLLLNEVKKRYPDCRVLPRLHIQYGLR